MSVVKIRQALEQAVAAVAPTFATAWENTSFVPSAGVPYQEISIISAVPENPTLGGNFTRERGILQVLLKYPAGTGSASAAVQAELLKATFFQGASFAQGGVSVICDGTPHVAPGFTDADRWCVPVRISYFANIS